MSWLLFFSGIGNGLLYGLMALGFTLLFRTANVPNLALGGIGTLAALLSMSLYTGLGLGYFPALFIALVIGAVIAQAVNWSVFSKLGSDNVLVALVASIGLNFVLIGVAQRFWAHGEPYRFPGAPSTHDQLLVAGLSSQHGLIVVATVVILGAIYWLLYRTTLGLEIRAVAEDRHMAHLVGVNVGRSKAISWMLMGGLVGLASVLFAPVLFLDTAILTSVMYKALGASVLGGLTSIGGAVVGGLLLGVVENMVVPFAPTAREAAAFIIIIVILAIRPQGLFGTAKVRKI